MDMATKPTLAMRIAAVMQMMNIESFPRNYELVYEAYVGGNAELAKEFRALGQDCSQYALDQLGRKYLPHHFEAGTLEAHTGKVKDEMHAFLEVLQEEQTSLAEYNQLVGNAMQTMASGKPDTSMLAQSFQALEEATRQRHERTETISRQVSQQTAALQAVAAEVASTEMQKYTDAVTGLGNRRLFNRELAQVFKDHHSGSPFGVAVIDLDFYERYAEKKMISNEFIRGLAGMVNSEIPYGSQLCRFDGCKFGLIYKDAHADKLRNFAQHMQNAIQKSNGMRGVSLSVGVCMSEEASDGLDIVTLAEKALRSGQSTGPSTVTFHTSPNGQHGARKNLAMYETGFS